MYSPTTYYGSNVALITPMNDDNSVDYPALESLIDFHIKSGTTAIVVVGTTGESATLSTQEHIKVLEHSVKYANKRILIIAGTGANSTEEALELTLEAKRVGADSCLIVTPYYNKPTQEGLYQHYKKIAEEVDILQILYNVPSRTAVNIDVSTTARLAQIDNIIGIKDATGNMDVLKDLKKSCPKEFLLLTGDDSTALDFILLGGHGGISVTANIIPKEIQQIYLLALSGKAKEAKNLNDKIAFFHKDLFIESNPIPVKWALHKMNKCKDNIRMPLTILSKDYQDIILKDLQKAKLL